MTLFYCLIWDTPNLEGQIPYLFPPGTGWLSYIPGHWVPFCLLLRLEGLRWRYSISPPHGKNIRGWEHKVVASSLMICGFRIWQSNKIPVTAWISNFSFNRTAFLMPEGYQNVLYISDSQRVGCEEFYLPAYIVGCISTDYRKGWLPVVLVSPATRWTP
jgi:hypothetical protein